jgi:phenylpropionate dioxygenase-like ring-hydroxylating dioxygenase large terminal subunit
MHVYNSISAQTDADYVSGLCDRVEAGLDEGLLPVEVFNDERVFRAEMDRIFTRAWVFLGHESEIPNPGDYMLRKIGLDSVIVTRNGKGEVNVLLNHCRHRGTEVCHQDRGNTTHFKCPYHGWIYKNDGDFVGAPDMRQAYGGRLDAKKWGLLKAPKVDSYWGFIFACLDENAPSLKEYLGGAAWMLDCAFGLHPDGMVALAPPERFLVKCDWKSGAENFSGDAYHVGTAHYSATASGFIQGDVRETGPHAHGYLFENGHSFIGHALYDWFGPPFGMWGYGEETQKGFDLSRFDAQQLDLMKKVPPTIGTIFPNLSYLRFPQPARPGEFPMPFTNIRMWQPHAPGVMELWVWEFDYKFASQQHKDDCYLAGQFGFGAGGIFEQDDTAVWEGIAKVGASPWARRIGNQLHYQQLRVDPDPDWQGPGQHFPSIYGEYCQEAFWRRWLSDMRAGA